MCSCHGWLTDLALDLLSLWRWNLAWRFSGVCRTYALGTITESDLSTVSPQTVCPQCPMTKRTRSLTVKNWVILIVLLMLQKTVTTTHRFPPSAPVSLAHRVAGQRPQSLTAHVYPFVVALVPALKVDQHRFIFFIYVDDLRTVPIKNMPTEKNEIYWINNICLKKKHGTNK